jgi:hypothetical protein
LRILRDPIRKWVQGNCRYARRQAICSANKPQSKLLSFPDHKVRRTRRVQSAEPIGGIGLAIALVKSIVTGTHRQENSKGRHDFYFRGNFRRSDLHGDCAALQRQPDLLVVDTLQFNITTASDA